MVPFAPEYRKMPEQLNPSFQGEVRATVNESTPWSGRAADEKSWYRSKRGRRGWVIVAQPDPAARSVVHAAWPATVKD
jgi:hypothetical protein